MARRGGTQSAKYPGQEHVRLLARARDQQLRGNHQAAIKHLRKAIKCDPRDVSGYLRLAQLQQQCGQWRESMQTYRACLRQAPQNIEALINLGMLEKRDGRLDAAIATYRRALSLRDDIPQLHNNLGNAWLDKAEFPAAIAAYQRAVELDPDFAGGWHNLGRCHLQAGQAAAALEPLRRAHRLKPDAWQFASDLADCLVRLPLAEPDPALEEDLLACLTLQRIDGRALGRAACRYLRQQPFAGLIGNYASGTLVIDENSLEVLHHPVLLAVLPREPLCDPLLERLLGEVRRQLLLADSTPATANKLIGALAEQCFLNEYLWEIDGEERETLRTLGDALQTQLDSDTRPEDHRLLLYACYQPLFGLLDPRRANALVATSGKSLQRVLHQQVLEPAEEAEYRQQMKSLAGTAGGVSEAVREQYEQNPYPRWRLIDTPERHGLADYLCRLFPHLHRQPPRFPERPAILCAGCGTGLQALRMARRIRSAEIFALDISSASLAYARRQAVTHGHEDIRFARGDILQLDDSIGRFDCIECFGVLHHLAEPEAGWHKLRRLLKPGGVMRIGLYSRTARAPIRRIRELIREHGYQPDIEGIRAVRRHIADLPATDPAKGLIHSPDFYTVSECRDLMFHVREHQLDLPTIAAMLARLELEFLGFEFDDFNIPQQYRSIFPHDPHGLDLANWHEFENRYPDTFASQYIFWVRSVT